MNTRFLFLGLFASIFLISCGSFKTTFKEPSHNLIIQKSIGDLNLDGITDRAFLTKSNDAKKAVITILIKDSLDNNLKILRNEYLTDGFIELYDQLPEIAIKELDLRTCSTLPTTP